MIKTVPLSTKELYVEWKGIEGDTFTVLRSHSPQDEFEVIAKDVNMNHFVDTKVNFMNHSLKYFYRVEGYSNGNKVAESDIETLRYQPKDNIANVVIHEAKVALRVMKNPPVALLIKRRDNGEGDKTCPECWNPITKRVRFADCDTCNGTGVIVGGYYPPIEFLISTDISAFVDESGMLDSDEVSKTPVNAWLANYPLITPGDVIVDTMNYRYRVTQVTPRTKSRYIIRQILSMVPIEMGDPAYKVEVDFDG